MNRIYQLDFLRFIAITPVFFLHFFASLSRNNVSDINFFVYNKIIRYGGWGVELFFIVSGFLMAKKILTIHNVNLIGEIVFYFKSRFLRIYPVFFISHFSE